jgi:hypothetical protein
MKNERDQEREPNLSALFLFIAHVGAALAALLVTPQIISHIAEANNGEGCGCGLRGRVTGSVFSATRHPAE